VRGGKGRLKFGGCAEAEFLRRVAPLKVALGLSGTDEVKRSMVKVSDIGIRLFNLFNCFSGIFAFGFLRGCLR
jgi:hypothetical protein